ncbi:MAG: ABC transporter ATP-binding protein [Candidatus Woesearchaeota archaeon]
MGDVILKVDNLHKAYKKEEVLSGINVEIHQGEIFGVIGSSGSGKTTLLNELIGFLAPNKGAVLFKSPHLLSFSKEEDVYRNVLKHPKEVKQMIGFAAQRPSIYDKLTLMENLNLFGTLYNLSKDARITNAKILLKLMGLYDFRNNLAESLSGGMLKRLDIACALIHDPKILILDEPTADLDPSLRKQMWHLIRKISQKGTTIILSSHFLDEMDELCDRIGIIHKGRMDHIGKPSELKKQYQPGDQVQIMTKYQRYDILQEKLQTHKKSLHIREMSAVHHSLEVVTHKPVEFIKFVTQVTQKIEDPILELKMNKPSLNEIFEEIIQQKTETVKEPPKKKKKRWWSKK